MINRTRQLLSVKQLIVRSLIALMLALPGAAPPALAQQPGLGRLFFTPQQRQELDRRRNSNIQASVITAEDLVTINGRVSRSSGRTTTWINGVPQEDTYRGPDPARVTVPKGEDAGEVSLRVGDTLDRVKGETRSGIAEGAISVRRNPR